MNVSTLRRALVPFRSLCLADGLPGARARRLQHSSHRIGIEGDHFALDGKPLQIISGELHYERIPREYWRDRLKKARAMGLNTISTYVFWNAARAQARSLRLQRIARRRGLHPHRRRKKVSTSSCVPDRTPAPSGIWAACPRGFSPIPTSFCAAPTRSSWPRPSAGCSAWAGNWPRCRSRTAARSSPCKSKTNTAPSATTTST